MHLICTGNAAIFTGIVSQYAQYERHQMRQVHFELGSQRHGNVLYEKDDRNLERAIHGPVLLDEIQNLIQVRPDVLLDNGNEESQLLKEKLF